VSPFGAEHEPVPTENLILGLCRLPETTAHAMILEVPARTPVVRQNAGRGQDRNVGEIAAVRTSKFNTVQWLSMAFNERAMT